MDLCKAFWVSNPVLGMSAEAEAYPSLLAVSLKVLLVASLMDQLILLHSFTSSLRLLFQLQSRCKVPVHHSHDSVTQISTLLIIIMHQYQIILLGIRGT